MRSKDISNVLEKFITSEQRSILIDGPWGCGKTYQVKEFLEQYKKNNLYQNKLLSANKASPIYYISLFGKKSVDEINTALFNIVRPKWAKFKKALNYVSLIPQIILPFKTPININGLIDGLAYAIKDTEENISLKENQIIIFDDLERLDESVSYTSLMGYFDSLFLAKTKIICLISSTNGLKKDKQRYDEFTDFKEKVFDRALIINESDQDIIASYFEDTMIDVYDHFLADFNNNIRLAQKTSFFLKEIQRYSTNNNIKLSDYLSEEVLLRHCLYTIKLNFEIFTEPSFKDNDQFRQVSYKHLKETFGENVANGLTEIYYESNNSQHYYPIDSILIEALLLIFMYRDYASFNDLFRPQHEKKYKKLFYYSDDNKKAIMNDFLNSLFSETYTFDNLFMTRLIEILNYFEDKIDDNTLNKIIICILKNYKVLKDREKIINHYLINLKMGGKEKPVIKLFINKTEERIKLLENDNIFKHFKLNYAKKNYYNLRNTLSKINKNNEHAEHSNIKDFILHNQFLLPDLTDDIEEDEWRFANEIANYINKIGENEKFLNYSCEICSKQLLNKSLIDRFKSLFISYSQIEFEKELDGYLKNKHNNYANDKDK